MLTNSPRQATSCLYTVRVNCIYDTYNAAPITDVKEDIMFRRTLAAFLLTFAPMQARDGAALDPQKRIVSISVDASILAAVVKLGSESHVPLGIVLGAGKPEKLCEEHKRFTLQSRPMSEFLDSLLAQSDYVWVLESGVIVIRPDHLSHQISQVLSMKFDRFGGMQTTMQGLGVILSGWIYSQLHPGAGVAGDILSSPDAQQFPEFKVQDASVEQILNRIVSLGDKGMWLLQMRQGSDHKSDIDLHTYSYKDDAHVLQTLCISADLLK